MEEKKVMDEEMLEKVTGAYVGPMSNYNKYVDEWKKITTACTNHGYRTAKCPNCGAPMPYIKSKSQASDKEVEYAQRNMMYCEECQTASADDKWVINQFN
jgi:hypothetical protein